MTPAEILAYFNGTIPHGIYPNCTLKVDCLLNGPVSGQIEYYPSLGGNLFYLSLFGAFLVIQLVQGLVWRTWGYSIAMALGLVLECAGYGGRVALSGNPFIFNSFLIYLICLTIGPVFFTASIYLCLALLIPLYDPTGTLCRFALKTYTYLFISADFFSLVLQAIGGGLSATAKTSDEEWTGIHIMISGLAFQVLSLIIFSALCAEFTLRVYRTQQSQFSNQRSEEVKGRRSWLKGLHAFELALAAATVFILVRSIFRCAELAEGFHGKLANEQVPFMVLEGAMVILACLCMTVWHPSWVLRGRLGQRVEGDEGSELTGIGAKIVSRRMQASSQTK